MKTAEHLPTFRKKKRRKKLLRRLVWLSPVLAVVCLVTAVSIASYQGRSGQLPKGQTGDRTGELSEEQDESFGTVIYAGRDTGKNEEQSSGKESLFSGNNEGNTYLPLLIQGTENSGGLKNTGSIENTEGSGNSDDTKHAGDLEAEEENQLLAVDDGTEIYITPRMTYTYEVYDARTDQLSVQETPIPNAMYGLNRTELEQYLTDLAAVENEGLTEVCHHYEVRLFSRREFTVRQTITQREPEYAVFLIAEQGYLVAYSGDRTQVYEYTHIPLGDFPLEQQAMLTGGVYMKTLADYYDFLESYSS